MCAINSNILFGWCLRKMWVIFSNIQLKIGHTTHFHCECNDAVGRWWIQFDFTLLTYSVLEISCQNHKIISLKNLTPDQCRKMYFIIHFAFLSLLTKRYKRYQSKATLWKLSSIKNFSKTLMCFLLSVNQIHFRLLTILKSNKKNLLSLCYVSLMNL